MNALAVNYRSGATRDASAGTHEACSEQTIQSGTMVFVGVDHSGVDAQRHLRIGVTDLRHHVRDWGIGRGEQADKGARQRVRRHALVRLPTRLLDYFVGLGDREAKNRRRTFEAPLS
jgi:hypothetical protein